MTPTGASEESERNVIAPPLATSTCRRYCSVPGCGARSGSMFQFPKASELRLKWQQVCKIQRDISKFMVVCLKHFEPSDIIFSSNCKKRLVRPGAVPSVELPETVVKKYRRINCQVHGCTNGTDQNHSEDGLKFHRFPSSLVRSMQWGYACDMRKIPSPRGAYICSIHFKNEDYISREGQPRARLREGAIPSQNIPGRSANHLQTKSRLKVLNPCCHTIGESFSSVAKNDDVDNSDSSDDDKLQIVCEDEDEDEDEDEEPQHKPQSPELDLELQSQSLLNLSLEDGNDVPTPLFAVDLFPVVPRVNMETVLSAQELQSLYSVLSKANEEKRTSDLDFSLYIPLTQNSPCESGQLSTNTLNSTRQEHAARISEMSTRAKKWTILTFIKTDIQMRALTGVTCALLDKLTELAIKVGFDSGDCDLCMREKIALTLCKLRINVPFAVLGTFFEVSRESCGRHFSETIPILAIILKSCIIWPSKEDISRNLPKSFKKYCDTRIVLDCIEIPVELPDCWDCRIKMNSHYKRGVSIKILVGVAPSGLLTFLSDSYGGNVSPEKIFEESDLIQKKMLQPGSDAIMVGQDFQIDNCCKEINVKVYRPRNLKKHHMLMKEGGSENVSIPNARVHVDQLMQMMKGFKILSGEKISWATFPFIDDILTVIGGLVNLTLPVISNDFSITEKDCACDL